MAHEDFQTLPPFVEADDDAVMRDTASVSEAIAPTQWQYTGPVDIAKIVMGDAIHDVRAMPPEAVEFLIEHHPSYGSWFKKQ